MPAREPKQAKGLRRYHFHCISRASRYIDLHHPGWTHSSCNLPVIINVMEGVSLTELDDNSWEESPICSLCSTTVRQGLNHLLRSGTEKSSRDMGETREEEEDSWVWAEFGKWQVERKDPASRWREKEDKRHDWEEDKKKALNTKTWANTKANCVTVKGAGRGKEWFDVLQRDLCAFLSRVRDFWGLALSTAARFILLLEFQSATSLRLLGLLRTGCAERYLYKRLMGILGAHPHVKCVC